MDTNELRQRRASLWVQAKALHDAAVKENRDMLAEEQQQWERINGEIDSLKMIIDREERIGEIEPELTAVPEPATRRDPEIRRIERHRENFGAEVESRLPGDEEYLRAFGSYLRHGLGGMEPELRGIIQPYIGAVPVQKRALGTGSAGAGGALVAEDFYRRLLEAMVAFGGMRQANTTKLQTSTGASMPIPLVDDTHNEGAILAQGSAVDVNGTDPSFGSKELGAYMYTSKLVRISLQLLQDGAFNVEEWLAGALGRRLGRVTNKHFTIGTGDGQPEGTLNAARDGAE